jgi:hypothetical protein
MVLERLLPCQVSDVVEAFLLEPASKPLGVRGDRHTGRIRKANAANIPNDQVLRWAARAVDGSRVISVDSVSRSDHRPSGTFRLIIEGPAITATEGRPATPAPAHCRRRPRRGTAAGLDAHHTFTAASGRAGQIARRAQSSDGSCAW